MEQATIEESSLSLAERASLPVGGPVEFQLLPKQYQFVTSNALEVLYSGALGAGKTKALCIRALIRAQHERARVGITRKYLSDLKATTLKTLLEWDGDCPPVLAEGTYKSIRAGAEYYYQLHGGGQIIPFGCDDEQKIGSLNLSDCLVDEAIELDERSWNMLMGRCRVTFKMPDGSRSIPTIAAATNPGPPNHFLYQRFFLDPETDPTLKLVLQTTSFENWFLPPAFFTRYRTLTGTTRQRYLMGEWCSFEGAVFPMFSTQKHEVHRTGPFLYHIAGVDVGFTHPTAVRVHGIDPQRRSHVREEFYKDGVQVSEIVAACYAFSNRYRPVTFVVDPSQPAVIKALKHRGMHVKMAENDVADGLRVLSDALYTEADDAKPELTFEPGLRGTREYMSYQWQDGVIREQPIKTKDDAIDADRYAMMEKRKKSMLRMLFRTVGGPEPKAEDSTSQESESLDESVPAEDLDRYFEAAR